METQPLSSACSSDTCSREYLPYKEWKLVHLSLLLLIQVSEYLTYKEWKLFKNTTLPISVK